MVYAPESVISNRGKYEKVTIVIPNYNGEKYIDECFSALTKQSYKDFDVILADNGSEDNSISKACQYKDKLDLKIKNLIVIMVLQKL